MITWNLAIQSAGGLFLAPIFFVFFVVARVQMRQVHVGMNDIPNATRQLFGYRMGSYLCLLMFSISLLPWIGMLLALRFDWNPHDVSEIEIVVFSSSNPVITSERIVSVTDEKAIARVCDGLTSLLAYHPEHEHAVGARYALRIRRRSDGQWSRYSVRIYPNKESTNGGIRKSGVYEMALHAGWEKLNLGSYQAIEFGRAVEQVVDIDGRKL